MKFEFDTRTDTAKDAAALVAALAVLHGPAVAEALEGAADRIDPRAVDGMPVDTTGTWEKDETVGLAAVTTATLEEVEGIDAFGIPWDARIHSSTKGMNKDGSWSRRRNTPDEVFDKVMAELKGSDEPNAAEAFGNPTPSEAPAAPAIDGSKAPDDTQDNGAQTSSTGQTATTAASPSSPVVPPPPPVPTASGEPITFPKLMVKITKAQTAQTIDAAKVVEFLGMFGLSAVKELASAPAETIQAVNDLVDAHVGA